MIPARSREGFTIIEVMLFLAITGLMMLGIFTAIRGTIDAQRYQDATASVVDYLQGQYNLVDNVQSNRKSTYTCAASGILGGASHRGTTNCSIVGRFVVSTDAGKTLTSQPIIATRDIKQLPVDTDPVGMGLVLASKELMAEDQDHTVAWATSVYVESGGAKDTQFAFAFVKNPYSGLTQTYYSSVGVTLASTLGSSPTNPIDVCVDPAGLVRHEPMGARILPLATNASGVQPFTSGSGDCV